MQLGFTILMFWYYALISASSLADSFRDKTESKEEWCEMALNLDISRGAAQARCVRIRMALVLILFLFSASVGTFMG